MGIGIQRSRFVGTISILAIETTNQHPLNYPLRYPEYQLNRDHMTLKIMYLGVLKENPF